MAADAAVEEPPVLPAILLVRRPEAALAAALHQRFRVLDFYASGQPLPAFLAAAAPNPPRAAIVMGGGFARVDAAFLDAVPSLGCVVSTGAGVDHIDLDECARRGVVVANSGKVYSADVADHAVGLLIDVLRRVSAAERFVRRGLWLVHGDYPLGSKLGGKRVGIIGLGNIGLLIAKRLEAFGCTIHYNSRRPRDSVSYKYFANVHDLASESDVLVVACALNNETRYIVNKDVINALGKDGIIINIGRGANIDEAELIRALKEGRIAGAGLDVFENEPRVPAELLSMDNVVLTHHIAVFTLESRSDLCDHMIGNLEAFFSGDDGTSPIMPKRGHGTPPILHTFGKPFYGTSEVGLALCGLVGQVPNTCSAPVVAEPIQNHPFFCWSREDDLWALYDLVGMPHMLPVPPPIHDLWAGYKPCRDVVKELISESRASSVYLQEMKLAQIDRSMVLETLGINFADNICLLPVDGALLCLGS